MEAQINISIKKPCSEKFEDFKATAKGGFCQSCEKEVIDFSTMSDAAIIQFFQESNGKTCGRFNQSQLNTFSHYLPLEQNQRSRFLSAGLISFSLFSLLSINNGQAQEKIEPVSETQVQNPLTVEVQKQAAIEGQLVNGRVVEEEGGLIGAAVVLKGTRIGTVTDFDGNFTFPQALHSGDTLLIQSIGYVTQQYVITNELESELIIVMPPFRDCFITGEVAVNTPYSTKPTFWKRLRSIF
jgi:hypothetical protein